MIPYSIQRLQGRLLRPFSRTKALRRKSSLRTRLTPAGWGFLALMLCGFLMSVNFSNNLIFALTFLLFGIAFVGWWQTRMNVAGLTFGQWKCEPVFAGQDIHYRLTIDNSSGRGRMGITVSSPIPVKTNEIEILASEGVELSVKRSTRSRGLLPSSSACLQSSFPLGLFITTLAVLDLPDCLVYPAPEGAQPLPNTADSHNAHLGRESDNYTDMRRYAPGDPLSRISWKAWARTNKLYTKEFDGAEGEHALWLNLNAVHKSGTESKISQLCRWVLDAQRQGREYGLDIPGTKIAPAMGQSHLRSCLKALALYGKAQGSQVDDEQ